MKALTPFELFHCYMRGWEAGAGVKPADQRFVMHKDTRFQRFYTEGWNVGVQARVKASAKAAKRFGYKPSILRTAKATDVL